MIAFKHIKHLVKKSFYCSIATVHNGVPHCSPVGSVYLENDKQGYYLEMFTTAVQKSKATNPMGCILVVNTSVLFWLTSLFTGKFATPPAVRLLVEFGERRPTSENEKERFNKRVNIFKRLKGHGILWGRPAHVRTFLIQEIIPVSLGKMTQVDYGEQSAVQ